MNCRFLGWLACLSGCAITCTITCSITSAEESNKLLVKKVGDRQLVVHQRKFVFPWYHVKADHNEIVSNSVWRRIDAPPGTKTSYIARYGEIEWHEYQNDTRDTLICQGLDFAGAGDKRRIRRGPGPVFIRRWCHEERANEGEMRFRSDRHYIVCLDRIPEPTFTNMAKNPSCDLDTELGHVCGIIEVEHHYDWRSLPNWKHLPIDEKSLLSFDQFRHGYPSDGYNLEYAIRRTDSGSFDASTPDGSTLATDRIVNLTLYALRSCEWQELKTPHRFRRSPPVTKSRLIVDTARGQKEVNIAYDHGGWFMEFGGKQYVAAYPPLLFTVHSKIKSSIPSRVCARTHHVTSAPQPPPLM